MEKIEKLFKILGFAQRARKVTLGMSATLGSLKKGRIQTIILASDLANNAEFTIKSNVKDKRVHIYSCCTKNDLGQLFGRNEIGILGIIDAGFAKAINTILNAS